MHSDVNSFSELFLISVEEESPLLELQPDNIEINTAHAIVDFLKFTLFSQDERYGI